MIYGYDRFQPSFEKGRAVRSANPANDWRGLDPERRLALIEQMLTASSALA